jgi:hypothetical protein
MMRTLEHESAAMAKHAVYHRSGAMICGVPVDGDTGTVPGGDAVEPVVPMLEPLLGWFG